MTFKALFHRRSVTQAMVNQVKARNENLARVKQEPVAQIPSLIFAAVQKANESKLEQDFVAQNSKPNW